MESKTNYPYKGNSVFFEQVKIQLFTNLKSVEII